MEVVRRGTAPELKLYDATCEVCKSDLRFTVLDGLVETIDGIRVLTVGCPVCHGHVTVETEAREGGWVRRAP